MLRRTLQILIVIVLAIFVWELSAQKKLLVNSCDQQVFDINVEVIKNIRCVRDLNVVYAAKNGDLYGIEDHFVYRSADNGESFIELGRLRKDSSSIFVTIKDTIARLKVVRFLRKNQGPRNLVVLDSGTILVFYDKVYRSDDDGKTFESVWDFDLGRGKARNNFPFVGVAHGPDDEIYLGEYDAESKRPIEVSIFRGTDDGRKWEEVFKFPAGEIFHIHSIQFDKYRNWYWVAAGDRDYEAALFYTRDKFKSIEKLGGGSQDWRIVSLIVTSESLYWGSDDDRNSGSIFRWDFQTSSLNKLIELGNVSYFSTVLDDQLLAISTTHEPGSGATKNSLTVPEMSIFVSKNGANWVKALTLDYESYNTQWGKAEGFLAFAAGHPQNRLWVVTRASEADELTAYTLEFNLSD